MREIAIAALLVLGGCPEHGKSPDGGLDGRGGEGGIVVADADPCFGDPFLSGELIDIDSKPNTFLAVSGAQLSLPPSTTVLATTQPNGHVEACVPNTDLVTLSLDAPGDYLDGTIVLDRGSLQGLHPLSLRMFTAARAATFYASLGLTFDATKAHVLVFQAGDRERIALSGTHGTPQNGNDDASPGTFVWSAGDTGRYVLFPNVDVTQPTATIDGSSFPVVVPLTAGTLTLAATSVVFI